ncbi:MAG: AMP-binding protein, partial [bacterium]|nr:AMP-binding protein [bacterium]
FNMYGPTEATIISTVLEIDRETLKEYEPLSSVPIGRPVANANLLILDRYLKLCPVLAAGELYISGDGIAAGYLCDPQKTFDTFISNSYKTEGNAGGYLYKTGDRARWLPGGNIEFLGRLDHQVKIRGQRIELGEIENCILAHEAVKETVIIAHSPNLVPGDTVPAEKFLCAYIVGKGDEDTEGVLREYLSRELPEYMIPTRFYKIDHIPLNPNGKVDLKALPVPELSEGDTRYTAPRDQVEKKLAEIWSEVLGVETESIGIDTNFFRMGGHSLRATIVIAKIHKELNVKLALAEMFKKSTIRGLAEHIKGTTQKKYATIQPTEKKEYYMLSSAQKRLYILQQM